MADKKLASVKVDAELLRRAKLSALQRSTYGRRMTVQEIFAEALRRYLFPKKKATPK